MFDAWLTKSAQRHWTIGLALGIVLLCVYSPVLQHDYLYHDDWLFFNDHASHVHSSADSWNFILGRPLEQYLLRGLFHLFATVETAWVARLVIVSAIFLFALLQWIYFQALGIDRITAGSLALGISVLPGMLVLGYWITAGTITFSLLASVAAALLATAGLKPELSLVRRAVFLAGACAFQTISLFFYQHGAMYFWTLAAVMFAATASRNIRSAVRLLAAYVPVGALPMLGYFIWFRYLSGLAPVLAAIDPERGKMATNIAETAKWFFATALPDASLLWFFDLPREFGTAVLFIFASILILFSARLGWLALRKGDRAGSFLFAVYPLVIAALSIAAFFPMLITNFRLERFLSFIPLSALMIATGTIHLGAIVRTERWTPIIKVGLASSFVFSVSCFATQSLASRMVLPAETEYAYVRNCVREATQRGRIPGRILALAPRQRPKFDTDEFDNLTLQDVAPMAQAIEHELGLRLGPVSFGLQGESLDREGALVVDFGELSKSGLWRPDSTQKAIHLWMYGTRFDLFVYQDLFYAVPRSIGPVNWKDGTVGSIPGVVKGTALSDVISRLPQDVPGNREQPTLLRSYRSYNLVAYRARVYGVPQTLGRLDEADWQSGRVANLPGVIIGNTAEEVLGRLR